MRHLFYTIVLLLNINSCKAQNIKTMDNDIIIPEVTKEFEKFDIDYYNENKIDDEIKKYNEKTNTLDVFLNYADGYSKTTYHEKSSFYSVRNYFLNSFIEIKGIRFSNGSEYGIWYEFDEEGKLVKEINTDEGYDYGWEEILAYCDKNEIVLTKGYPKRGGIQTEIYKNEEEGKKIWTISYYNHKKDLHLQVTLDGVTGKELNKKELEFVD